jgi:hypothetical protein
MQQLRRGGFPLGAKTLFLAGFSPKFTPCDGNLNTYSGKDSGQIGQIVYYQQGLIVQIQSSLPADQVR